MTIGEFRAWLEGFSEAMGSSPNIKQWKKIQERLDSVSDTCNHSHSWWPTWYWTDFSVGPCATNDSSATITWDSRGSNTNSGDTIYTASTAIGKQEAEMLS